MVQIGLIGDYDPGRPSHQKTVQALEHSAGSLGIEVEPVWLPTPSLETLPPEELYECDGLWCSPGSPYRSAAGALRAIRLARENNRPFFGT